MIGRRLNFKKHIDCTATEASFIAATISRILSNIGEPKQSRRLLLSRVVSSILLYAASLWTNILVNKVNCRKLGMAYRLSAVWVCSAYRTRSGEAVHVLAGMFAIEILANEGRRFYDKMYADGGLLYFGGSWSGGNISQSGKRDGMSHKLIVGDSASFRAIGDGLNDATGN